MQHLTCLEACTAAFPDRPEILAKLKWLHLKHTHCAVDASTISLMERGKMPNASFNVLAKIARGLGLSLDELSDLPKEALTI